MIAYPSIQEISIHQHKRKTEYNKVVVKRFNIGDVEDPEVYAAFPIGQWEKSEHGQWCVKNSIEPVVFYTGVDNNIYGYKIEIIAVFTDKDLTFHELKWGSNN
jgi:hypothetical protein